MLRIEDLPAPDLPISRTLRCLRRRVGAGAGGRVVDVLILVVFLGLKWETGSMLWESECGDSRQAAVEEFQLALCNRRQYVLVIENDVLTL